MSDKKVVPIAHAKGKSVRLTLEDALLEGFDEVVVFGMKDDVYRVFHSDLMSRRATIGALELAKAMIIEQE